jgi:hypothetical protein
LGEKKSCFAHQLHNAGTGCTTFSLPGRLSGRLSCWTISDCMSASGCSAPPRRSHPVARLLRLRSHCTRDRKLQRRVRPWVTHTPRSPTPQSAHCCANMLRLLPPTTPPSHCLERDNTARRRRQRHDLTKTAAQPRPRAAAAGLHTPTHAPTRRTSRRPRRRQLASARRPGLAQVHRRPRVQHCDHGWTATTAQRRW